MSKYDFSTLNDQDFEELVRDLISKELNIRFQSFKSGADKGIDLLYSTSSHTNQIVIQAKHYQGTGFKGLLNSLKKEKEKVIKLKPKRYLIATSVKLSPQYKKEILSIFQPYLKSASDIYGNEDLNKLLLDYADIEIKYYKLWLTSSNVLRKLLNNAVEGRSEFLRDKIQRNIKTYVQNSSLNQLYVYLRNINFF